MPRIIPLRELNNASKVSSMCHENDSPVFITKNGVSDMVIMSSETYDRICSSKPYDYTPIVFDKASEASTLNEYMTIRDSKPLYSIAELKETLSPIFKKFNVKKAVLFGSYVKGTADARSDIDLVVDTNLRGLYFYGLLGEVTNALRFPVDLIEKKQIEPGSEMEQEIERTGVTIYG